MTRIIPSTWQRVRNRLILTLPNPTDRNTLRFRYNVAKTLDDAYGSANGVPGSGPSEIATLPAKGSYISRNLRRSGSYIDSTNYSRVSVAVLDLDYESQTRGPATYPMDDETTFLRFQSFLRTANAWVSQDPDPILLIPPYNFMTTDAPVATFSGTTPAIPSAAAGVKPPMGAMNIHLPNHSRTVNVTNNSTWDTMFVSFGYNLPMQTLTPGDTINVTGAMAPELFVVSTVNVPFSANFTIAN